MEPSHGWLGRVHARRVFTVLSDARRASRKDYRSAMAAVTPFAMIETAAARRHVVATIIRQSAISARATPSSIGQNLPGLQSRSCATGHVVH